MGVTVKPFRAARPTPELVSKVAELPYDVMNAEEARVIAEGNPHSFLRVDKAEIDLPPDIDHYDPRVYAKAKENLDAMISGGVLVQDEKPCLYIYQQEVGGRVQTGLAACVSAEEYDRGLIKKHEFTRADKELDRINHVSVCSAHTGPIFLAYRETKSESSPSALIKKWTAAHDPVYNFTTDDGVRHTVWVIDDVKTQEALTGAFGSVPCMYIADGHHRNASALKVAQMRNKDNADPEAEHNFYLAVIFPHDELKIMDYNRVVTDLNGLSKEAFIETLEKDFTVEKSDAPVRPDKKAVFGMYLNNSWYRMTLKNATDPSDVIGNLDVSVMQNKVLSPILGINDPKTDKRIDFVGGIRGLDELVRRVDSGEMAVAFAMHPTSMDELMAVSDADKIMPPKSTWFEPNLRSGLLIHLF